MRYRKIGNTGLELSVIGTGCWSFGGGEYWGAQDQGDATDVVHASVDCGINYFDTAEMYNEGRSELSLGEAIKGIPRDKVVIGSKVGPSNAYRDTLVNHCEESLKRLKTDYLDIYMLHWPIHPHSVRHFTKEESVINNPPTYQEAFEAMLQLRRQGKIRFAGISNFSFKRMKEDIPAWIDITVNQMPFNLLCRAIEFDTLPYCNEKGIGVIGYMTLMQGILTGKYATLDDIPEWQRRTRHFSCTRTPKCRHGEPGFEKETAEALENIRKVAAKYGITMADLSAAWAVESGITCALAGSRNARQLEENARAGDILLTADIMEELNDATKELRDRMGNHADYFESKENDRT